MSLQIEQANESQSEILFNVKQCEELFQKDKSEKLKADIETFKANIQKAKEVELNFYKSLRLAANEKRRIFQFKEDQVREERSLEEKVIVWDPVKGNLIMTQKEYEQTYKNQKSQS